MFDFDERGVLRVGIWSRILEISLRQADFPLVEGEASLNRRYLLWMKTGERIFAVSKVEASGSWSLLYIVHAFVLVFLVALIVARVEGRPRLLGKGTLPFMVQETLLSTERLLVLGHLEAWVVWNDVASGTRRRGPPVLLELSLLFLDEMGLQKIIRDYKTILNLPICAMLTIELCSTGSGRPGRVAANARLSPATAPASSTS